MPSKGVQSGVKKLRPSVDADGWSRNDPYFIFKDGYKICKCIVAGNPVYMAYAPRVGDVPQPLAIGSLDVCKKACQEKAMLNL